MCESDSTRLCVEASAGLPDELVTVAAIVVEPRRRQNRSRTFAGLLARLLACWRRDRSTSTRFHQMRTSHGSHRRRTGQEGRRMPFAQHKGVVTKKRMQEEAKGAKGAVEGCRWRGEGRRRAGTGSRDDGGCAARPRCNRWAAAARRWWWWRWWSSGKRKQKPAG